MLTNHEQIEISQQELDTLLLSLPVLEEINSNRKLASQILNSNLKNEDFSSQILTQNELDRLFESNNP